GLVESESRTPADTERMIHAAHGACFHWLEVGSPLNHLRAQCLLATAYAKAEMPDEAVRHAERCLELSREVGDAQTAFDRATAHGCASVAYALAGRVGEARKQHEMARSFASGLEDRADRDVFNRLYPAPTGSA